MSHKPSTYGCETCESRYNMGAETVVRVYTRQPWFNHLETICPGCGTHWYVWQLEEASIGYLAINNQIAGDAINFEYKEFAPNKIWRKFCAGTGRPYPTPAQISWDQLERIDRIVAFEAWSLDQGETWQT